MIDSKKVYEWAKKERDDIKYYLEHDWIYSFDCDFDSQIEYKEHCRRMEELKKKLDNVLEWLQDEINSYEQEEADAMINSQCFF
jgi:hypothetical protein